MAANMKITVFWDAMALNGDLGHFTTLLPMGYELYMMSDEMVLA
jgi:hypothetical protein